MRQIEHSLLDQLSRAWYYGNWKAETPAEKMMEAVMTRLGYWPTTEDEIFSRPDSYREMEEFLKNPESSTINQVVAIEKTMLRSELQSGDCIGFYSSDNTIHLGIIQSFEGNSTSLKAVAVLVDGRRIPLERIRERIKSNEIHLTK